MTSSLVSLQALSNDVLFIEKIKKKKPFVLNKSVYSKFPVGHLNPDTEQH